MFEYMSNMMIGNWHRAMKREKYSTVYNAVIKVTCRHGNLLFQTSNAWSKTFLVFVRLLLYLSCAVLLGDKYGVITTGLTV